MLRVSNAFVIPRIVLSPLPLDALFYDVYTELSELHLSKVGLDTSWYDVDVGENSTGETIWGETRKYFTMRTYRLPIARLKEKMSTV